MNGEKPPWRARYRRLRSPASWAGSWRALSLEKKLGIAVIPLAAALIGLFVPLLVNSNGDAGSGKAASAAQESGLSVTGLLVTNGPDRWPEINVLLQNNGHRPSLVDGVSITVLSFARARERGCPPHPSASYVTPPAPFEVVLPADGRGSVPAIPVAQEIRAAGSLRIRLRSSLDDPLAGALPELPLTIGVSRFFQVAVRIQHDGVERPLLAGKAILAVPFPEQDLFADDPNPVIMKAVRPCVEPNRSALRKILRLPGARDSELDRFAANPDANYVGVFAAFQGPLTPSDVGRHGINPRAAKAALPVAERFWKAVASADFAIACRLLPWEARAVIGAPPKGCVGALRSQLRALGGHLGSRRAHLTAIGATAESALIEVEIGSKPKLYISVVRGRDWVVADAYPAYG